MNMNDKTVKGIKSFFNDLGSLFTNGEPSLLRSIGKDTGEFGEYASEYVLNNMALTNLSYIRTVHNVYLEINGFTTEIDVLALTEKGIFVLESKNYGGWIFGSTDSKQWMQMFKNGEKNQFYSPIKQNESHVKKLAVYLGIESNMLFSLIVFSDRCELKKIPPDTEHIKVIQRNQLLWVMKRELKNGQTLFTKEQIDAMYDKLMPLTQKTVEEKQQHIEEVKNLKSGMICPLCKKELVLRKGKYGEFYGCSGFPECTFKRKK